MMYGLHLLHVMSWLVGERYGYPVRLYRNIQLVSNLAKDNDIICMHFDLRS